MKYSLAKALRKNKRRTARARMQDKRMRNRHLIKRTQRKRFYLWFLHPGRYDLQGIDTPTKRRVVGRVRRKLKIRTKEQANKFSGFIKRVLIRRKARPMNIGLQNYKLRKYAQSRGVASDLIDFKNLVDRKLTLRENKQLISGKVEALATEPNLEKYYNKRLTRAWVEGYDY